MSKEEIAKLRRKLRRLHNKLCEIGPVMRGSVVHIGSKTKRYHFSLNKDKKTQLIYLGDKRLATAQHYSYSAHLKSPCFTQLNGTYGSHRFSDPQVS